MNRSLTTLLLASCISLPLYSMEHEALLSSNTLTSLTEMNIEDIKNLYQRTHEKLELIAPKNYIDATKKNDIDATNLLEIIQRTNHLKAQGITEEQIGTIAFNEKRSFKDTIDYYCSSLGQWPHNGPHYVSVFFAKLKTYNKLIAEKNFTTPTEEQCNHYRDNRKQNRAIRCAASFNLVIDKTTPLKEENTPKETTNTVATQEFYKFIADIYIMRCTAPTDIETIASLLYGSINTKKQ